MSGLCCTDKPKNWGLDLLAACWIYLWVFNDATDCTILGESLLGVRPWWVHGRGNQRSNFVQHLRGTRGVRVLKSRLEQIHGLLIWTHHNSSGVQRKGPELQWVVQITACYSSRLETRKIVRISLVPQKSVCRLEELGSHPERPKWESPAEREQEGSSSSKLKTLHKCMA